MNSNRVFCGLLLCLVMTASASAKKKFAKEKELDIDLSQSDFRSGDIVFQHLPSKLGSVICDVTNSPWSHCGMVVERKGELYVIEAIGPVRYIELKTWINQGDKERFMQMRVKDVSVMQIERTVAAAEAMLGRPYDIQYELDDEKIYCSELVYKAYRRGAGIEVGTQEELGKLNWRGSEAFIRAITGGSLPLERVMVTPLSVAVSPRLMMMHWQMPPQKQEPLYDQSALAGKWTGDYTIKGLTPATATVEFDRRGGFLSGGIQLADDSHVAFEDLRVTPFKSQREFTGKLRDARPIETEIQARILDEGRRIIGTWKDELGNRGVFSFVKEPKPTLTIPALRLPSLRMPFKRPLDD